MNKRGQFYLIAGVIIAGLIVGLFAIIENPDKKYSVKIEEIAKDLMLESEKFKDYELYNETENETDFLRKFSIYAGPDIEIVYIVGEKGNLESKTLQGDSIVESEYDLEEHGDIATLNFKGEEYNFSVYNGENFYFLVSQELEDQNYVKTS